MNKSYFGNDQFFPIYLTKNIKLFYKKCTGIWLGLGLGQVRWVRNGLGQVGWVINIIFV